MYRRVSTNKKAQMAAKAIYAMVMAIYAVVMISVTLCGMFFIPPALGYYGYPHAIIAGIIMLVMMCIANGLTKPFKGLVYRALCTIK